MKVVYAGSLFSVLSMALLFTAADGQGQTPSYMTAKQLILIVALPGDLQTGLQALLAVLHDVHFSGPDDGWLCGNNGKVYHFAESAWSQISAATTTNFHCIYALSENNVWAGGGSGRIFHYEGVSWVRVATPTTTAIREMAFTSPTEGWAACDDGVILHYDGVSWKKFDVSPATSESFSGLYMVDGKHGWAVGTNGVIYEYRNFPSVTPASVGRIKALMR